MKRIIKLADSHTELLDRIYDFVTSESSESEENDIENTGPYLKSKKEYFDGFRATCKDVKQMIDKSGLLND